MRFLLKMGLVFTLLFLICLTTYAQEVNLDEKVLVPPATPESQGVSSQAIAEMIDAIDTDINSMNSIMILRHGKVIAETWWAPNTPDTPHAMYSLSKSFTSTAAGFAATEGKLDIEKPIIQYFPDDLPNEISDNLRKMKVRNVLSMAGGHDQEPSYNGLVELTRDTEEMMKIQDNWAKIFLAYPVEHEPGTFFRYNSLGTYMISATVQKLTGERIVDYLQPRLWEPLHIKKPFWEISPQGINKGGSGLFLRTEDMAKFGQLYLQKGKWNGKQLIPETWIDEATTKQVSNGDDPNSDWAQGYCFQFWRCRHNIFRGDGMYSQFIVVIPDKDAVIVSTADSNRYQDVLNYYWDRLLPAMKDNVLLENPAALERLRVAETGRIAKNGDSGSDVFDRTVQSKILGKEMKYKIYLPAGYKATGYAYPVLYLLHGLGDNQDTWCDEKHGNLRPFADEWFKERGLDKMIVVMPDAGRTWYVNGPLGRYEDYFFQELIPQIEKSYRCKTDKRYRAIVGLSMGGHGALLYSLHHPEMFQTCYAMSSGIRTDNELRQMPLDAFQDRYGVKISQTDERFSSEINANRVIPLVQSMPESQRQSVRFFIDCGDDDFLISGNCELHLEMKRLGIPHEFRVRNGAHNWEYWREALPMAFEFITEGFAAPSFVMNLWPEGAPVNENSTENVEVRLHAFLPESSESQQTPAVVICPGGGYGGLCIEPEGFKIAQWLNQHGIAGFVAEYRLPAGRKTVPLADAQRAIRTVRANAVAWNVDPNKIGIIGFSAGGHLAACATVHFDAGKSDAKDPVEQVSCRPDFSILIYPVVSMMETLTHGGTRLNLLGENPDTTDVQYYSNELNISEETPPTFLAHAKDDTLVPPENSRVFTEQMLKHHRPVVYLELENGGHGLNGYRGESWDRWQREAIRWINEM